MKNCENETNAALARRDLTSILDQLIDRTEGQVITLRDITRVFSSRMFGPLLLIPAILAIAPTGAIPGMPIITGTIIFAISLQLLFFKDSPWLPEKILLFSFSREKLRKAINFIRPTTVKIDQYVKPRLSFLLQFPYIQISALVCLIMSILMFPLSLVPFAVFLPGFSIAMIALGLTSHDGLFVIIGGLIAIVIIIGLSYYYYL